MRQRFSKDVLFSWIGFADIQAATEELENRLGPIATAALDRQFSTIVLLSDHSRKITEKYCKWLKQLTEAEIKTHQFSLSSPTHFGEIYEAALTAIEAEKRRDEGAKLKLTYHLSPGTPAMAAIWILLAKTSQPAELIESSHEKGVQTVSFPFELAVDYLPNISRKTENEIMQLTQGLPPEVPEFSHIVHRSKEMKKVVALARRLAAYDVPVMILGESGTGKELLARAIHASSPRSSGPFVAVNCGAIPAELVEAEFFGYVKGAFTGAVRDAKGYLESADGGTLFLDEIGELPLQAQVKLLRAVQEGAVQKLGSTKTRKVDFRIIAATNRNIQEEVAKGNFREDLFHRLAVGVLNLPPLRERKGDMDLLIDYFLDRINRDLESKTRWIHKKLSAGARNLLHQQPWPGNVRELYNTLCRAVIWTPDEVIYAEDIKDTIFPVISTTRCEQEQILGRSLDGGVDLPQIMAEVARHYLTRALLQAQGNKTLAARLVGLPSYQTFTNWMKKYGVEI